MAPVSWCQRKVLPSLSAGAGFVFALKYRAGGCFVWCPAVRVSTAEDGVWPTARLWVSSICDTRFVQIIRARLQNDSLDGEAKSASGTQRYIPVSVGRELVVFV